MGSPPDKRSNYSAVVERLDDTEGLELKTVAIHGFAGADRWCRLLTLDA